MNVSPPHSRGGVRGGGAILSFCVHPSPECYVILDLTCHVAGVGIVPGGVLISVSVVHDIVITGFAFPGAGGVGIAILKIVPVNRLRWEVVVSFYYDCVVAFC